MENNTPSSSRRLRTHKKVLPYRLRTRRTPNVSKENNPNVSLKDKYTKKQRNSRKNFSRKKFSRKKFSIKKFWNSSKAFMMSSEGKFNVSELEELIGNMLVSAVSDIINKTGNLTNKDIVEIYKRNANSFIKASNLDKEASDKIIERFNNQIILLNIGEETSGTKNKSADIRRIRSQVLPAAEKISLASLPPRLPLPDPKENTHQISKYEYTINTKNIFLKNCILKLIDILLKINKVNWGAALLINAAVKTILLSYLSQVNLSLRLTLVINKDKVEIYFPNGKISLKHENNQYTIDDSDNEYLFSDLIPEIRNDLESVKKKLGQAEYILNRESIDKIFEIFLKGTYEKNGNEIILILKNNKKFKATINVANNIVTFTDLTDLT